MARVKFNRVQIDLTARTKARILVARTVDQIERGARVLIPVGSHVSGSGAPSLDPPLLSSLYSHIRSNAREVVGTVGARTTHALTVHQGSRAHVIRGRGKMLKFRWERGDFLVAARSGRRRGNRRSGRFHYFVKVTHPGNKNPVRYLTTPLSMFGTRNGFVVLGVGFGARRLP